MRTKLEQGISADDINSVQITEINLIALSHANQIVVALEETFSCDGFEFQTINQISHEVRMMLLNWEKAHIHASSAAWVKHKSIITNHLSESG